MNDIDVKPFRFGVVATPHGGAQAWRDTATRSADRGFDTLLMPDGLQLLSPTAALAVAAALTDLRVGTYVLAGPMRPPRLAAWEGHSLAVLTDGRFDFGIGTGRPGVDAFAAQLGLPYGTGEQRRAQVGEAIDALRELDGSDRHTPVLMAAGGPKARALAARRADLVTLALSARTTREQLLGDVRDLWARADDRARRMTVMMNLFVVGDEVPAHAERYLGADAATMIANDSPAMLRGNSPRAMADELERRRETFGISYFAVNADFADRFAPVIERLRGR